MSISRRTGVRGPRWLALAVVLVPACTGLIDSSDDDGAGDDDGGGGGGGGGGGDPEPVDLSCLVDAPSLTATERMLIEMPADSWTSFPGTAFDAFCDQHGLDGNCKNVIEAW